jgi:predicted nucleic acid-binding protein
MQAAALDTNVIIDIFHGDKGLLSRINRIQNIYTPAPVRAELLFGAYLSKRHEIELERVTLFLAQTKTIVCGKRVADKYAAIRATLQSNGLQIPENDCWIAACCITKSIPLITRDIRHFQRIDELHLHIWQ